MSKKTLISQAELRRMAAIAKSEGVVVSIEVDGRKFSISPYTPNATLAVLSKKGVSPTALEKLPDGTLRWHLTPTENNDDDLDRELAEFDRHNGYL